LENLCRNYFGLVQLNIIQNDNSIRGHKFRNRIQDQSSRNICRELLHEHKIKHSRFIDDGKTQYTINQLKRLLGTINAGYEIARRDYSPIKF
jgi:hypothetical protein